jgi:hypothetical protein
MNADKTLSSLSPGSNGTAFCANCGAANSGCSRLPPGRKSRYTSKEPPQKAAAGRNARPTTYSSTRCVEKYVALGWQPADRLWGALGRVQPGAGLASVDVNDSAGSPTHFGREKFRSRKRIPVTSFQNNLQTIHKLAAYWQIRRKRRGRFRVSGCYTCSQGREVVVDLSPACRVRRRLLGGLGARDSLIDETFTCEPPPIDGHLPLRAANGISGCGTCTFPGLHPEPAATGLPRR